MSEELLKALIQLYAIVSKQNNGPTAAEKDLVFDFLSQSLDEKNAQKYFTQFIELTEKNNSTKRVSVIDSVAVIGEAKQINKILTQKQKVIVLLRIIELAKLDQTTNNSKLEIVNTISDVFNISKSHFTSIKSFVYQSNFNSNDFVNIAILNSEKVPLGSTIENECVSILFIDNINLYLFKLFSNNGVKWNGTKIQSSSIGVFAAGGILKIGNGKPIYYQEITSLFISQKQKGNITFNVNNIGFSFSKEKIALHDINISEKSGNLVGIMGASGSGKTTLLNIISGIEKPSVGSVLLNGINIHKNPELIQGTLGFVPQDDLLIENLTVFENLFYSAKFCFDKFPKNLITEKVNELLESLGLFEIKDLKVGNAMNKVISGGQRKRLNIALELIREPAVLFLDEPTSGLSSRDSENIIKLLNQLTNKGNLVFVVIHQPSSEIYKLFDKIFLLDKGGFPIYYGNPIESISYFKKIDNWISNENGECAECGNVNSESIFDIVESETIDEYGNYTGKRKVLPEKWNQLYKEKVLIKRLDDETTPPENFLDTPNKLKQLSIYIKRDVISKLRNKQYVLINLIEIPLLAFILSFIIRYSNSENSEYVFRENDNLPSYIFMAIIVFLFMGISLSAEEIFNDKKNLKRERFLNLSWSSYLLSKAFIMFVLSAIFACFFVIIGNSLLDLKGMFFSYWFVLFSVGCCANLIGLNISSAFDSVVTIYILIPILIIPQMILGGAMFSYEKLNRFVGGGYRVPIIAEFIPARWAYEALMVNQFVNNEFEKPFYLLEKQESVHNYVRGPYTSFLNLKLDEIENELNKTTSSVRSLQFVDNVNLLKNEIENQEKLNSQLKFGLIKHLVSDKIYKNVIDSARSFIAKLELQNTLRLNKIVAKKEMLLFNMQKSEKEKFAFRQKKNDYYNDNLSDLVKSTYTLKKCVANEGKVLQVIDPIYNETKESSFLNFRTHFFSPNKMFLGVNFSTFAFNVIVLWSFVIVLYILLYFNVLHKIINKF